MADNDYLYELFSESKYEEFFTQFNKHSSERKLEVVNSLFESETFDEKDYSFFLNQLFNGLKKENLISKIPLYLEKETMTSLLDILANYQMNQLAIDVMSSLTKDSEKLYDYVSNDFVSHEELAFAVFNHAQFKKESKVGFDNEYFEAPEELVHKILSNNTLFDKYQSKLKNLKISPISLVYLAFKEESNEALMKVVFNNYDKYLDSNLDMLEKLKQDLFIKSKGKHHIETFSFRDLSRIVVPLMEVANNPNSTLAQNNISGEFILSKLRETAFNNIDTFGQNINKNLKYSGSLLNKIINHENYNEELAKIDYQSLMVKASHTSTDNENEKNKKHFTKNNFALFFATQIAKKFKEVSLTNFEGHNALTLYLQSINKISHNNEQLNLHVYSHDINAQKAQEPLNMDLIKTFYENNSKLFLQANSFGKYPWDYLSNKSISIHTKFNDGVSLLGPLHQYEMFLDSVGLIDSYNKIKEFEQKDETATDPTKEESKKHLSFFAKLLNIFPFKAKEVELIEEVAIPKENVVKTFTQKLDSNKELLNEEVLNKITEILALSTELNLLIQDDKNSIESSILIKNTLKNYLPTIVDNFVAMNELKSQKNDNQATKITLEQLNLLEQKLMSIKEEAHHVKEADIMAKVESFGSFLNNKTQKTLKM